MTDIKIKEKEEGGKAISCFTIKVPQTELDIYHTLRPGQSFTWKELSPNAFCGVIAGNLVTLEYARKEEALTCTVLGRAEGAPPLGADGVRHYLRLDVSLKQLDEMWRRTKTQLGAQYLETVSVLPAAPGVRLLRQDPVEALFSFICSQNNNVKRIHGIVQRLRAAYGTPIATIDGEVWCEFPTLEALAAARLDVLKEEVSLGYRAPYIIKSAQACLEKGGRTWLEGLAGKGVSWADARRELLALTGVGPKVADCVCLYGLEKLDVTPVDVHVFTLAKRTGMFGKKCTTLTQSNIDKIGKAFRETFGEYAGWAQAVMFTAEIEKQTAKEEIKREEEEEEEEKKVSLPKRKKLKRI